MLSVMATHCENDSWFWGNWGKLRLHLFFHSASFFFRSPFASTLSCPRSLWSSWATVTPSRLSTGTETLKEYRGSWKSVSSTQHRGGISVTLSDFCGLWSHLGKSVLPITSTLRQQVYSRVTTPCRFLLSVTFCFKMTQHMFKGGEMDISH